MSSRSKAPVAAGIVVGVLVGLGLLKLIQVKIRNRREVAPLPEV